MADKLIPDFKFNAIKWTNDKISSKSREVKSLFIDICCLYWLNNCKVTIETLKEKFSNENDLLEKLIDSNIIKLTSETEYFHIKFLDEQYDKKKLLSDKRKQIGSIGGKSKGSKKDLLEGDAKQSDIHETNIVKANAKQLLLQESNKSKEGDLSNDKETPTDTTLDDINLSKPELIEVKIGELPVNNKIPTINLTEFNIIYDHFLEEFNKITNKKYTNKDTRAKTQFYNCLLAGYAMDEILKSVQSGMKSKWVKGNMRTLSPTHFLQTNMIEKYLQEEPIEYYEEEITEILTEVKEQLFSKEKSKPVVKITNNKFKFIDELFQIFKDEYLLVRKTEYAILKSKEWIQKGAIIDILTDYKKLEANKNKNSEEVKKDFRNFFKRCLQIKETFHYNAMSPLHVANFFNPIKILITNGKSNRKGREPGTTDEQFREIMSGKFDGYFDI